MSYDVFISYSRRDYKDKNNQIIPGNIISQIKEMFDANGITYWFDEDGVFSGDAFAPTIAKNIRSSSIFLFVSSVNSNASEWTSNEIATAHTFGKKIIPFKFDNSVYNDSVIIYIARLDYIDYPTNPTKALQRLLQSVQTHLSREAGKSRIDDTRRSKEEMQRQERAARIKALHEKIADLTNRQFAIETEILEKEKSLTDLRNEKLKVEAYIAALKEEVLALSVQKGASKGTGKSPAKNNTFETINPFLKPK